MKMRVTITLDPVVHRRAKEAARARRATVSGLVGSLLKAVDAKDDPASVVDEMVGMATLREPPPSTDPLYDALKAKYVH